MEVNKEENGYLDLLIRPGFCVKNNQITAVNHAARTLSLSPGASVTEFLMTGAQEYADFQGGCLYLHLNLPTGNYSTSVIRMDGLDYFILDQESCNDVLTAMALAARVLREPLTSMMISAQQLTTADSPSDEHLARINRSMHQMLRLIGNMSDAGQHCAASPLELRDITAVFGDIFEKADAFIGQAGRTLRYVCDVPSLQSLVNSELLERAVLNILSNAIKFSAPGSEILAQLTRRGRTLTLSIQDSGSGIARDLQHTLFQRYLRQPGIEDGRYGLGLGMLLVRNAAAAHGGTVLIDQPGETGTRVSITMSIRQDTGNTLCSPVLRVDYAGEQEHGLVELADCLPPELYSK